MSVEIKIPSLGESITEATISAILVASGSSVEMDQEIIEIETEKVNQTLYAPSEGVLNLSVKEGDSVTIGQVIGSVEPGSAKSEEKPKEQEPEKKEPEPKKEEAPKAAEEPSPSQSKPKESEKKPQTLFEQVRQTPEAFAEEIKAPQKEPSRPQEAPKKPSSDSPREERQKMSKIRQTIARRLVDAKQSMAMLTTFNEVDMSRIMQIRSEHKEAFLKKHGVKLGFMSFFVKAAAHALQHYPDVNAYIDGEDIVFRKYVDINVAISTDRGLVVPVIQGCDELSFADIEKTIISLSEKARDGKLSMDEMRPGGFSITNGGIFGSSFSTPIVNPPQSAILGMHKIAERPCAINGEVKIRPTMVLALSYDHRIVDGKQGVSFLAHIVRLIEDPTCLLIDL